MKIIWVEILELKEVPEFRELYSQGSLDDLIESYLLYGQQVPIHISMNNEIINGYRMVDAVRVAGGKTVFAQVIDGVPDMKKRITLNMYRQKTTEDQIREIGEVLRMFPKRK